MIWLYVLIGVVALLQIVLFVMGRRIRKKEKETHVLLKYDIDTRQRAWQLMADPSIPAEDKAKIKALFEAE